MMDIGIWVLSDRAVELLMKKCGWNDTDFAKKIPAFYDLYSAFGTCLGNILRIQMPKLDYCPLS